MIKLGFVGGTGCPHGVWFAEMINGLCEKH